MSGSILICETLTTATAISKKQESIVLLIQLRLRRIMPEFHFKAAKLIGRFHANAISATALPPFVRCLNKHGRVPSLSSARHFQFLFEG